MDKLPVLGSERQPFVAAALFTAWAAYLKGQAGGPALKRLGRHSHSERKISCHWYLQSSSPSLLLPPFPASAFCGRITDFRT